MSSDFDRRNFLMGTAATLGAFGCKDTPDAPQPNTVPPATSHNTASSSPAAALEAKEPVQSPPLPTVTAEPLVFPWRTPDPFLFCVHHLDRYPAGNEEMAPNASLAGRNIGSDFSGRDGWSMYHGDTVPGFPRHPHRGFETVTVARQGHIDHSDSLGATARFGQGDAQWMTAGRGIVHSEMFPLRKRNAPNTAELFQLWLNLPQRHKMVEPNFTMFWHETIPTHRLTDGAGRTTVVTTVAGTLGDKHPPSPPPHSWAAMPEHHVAIWTIELEANATWLLPETAAGINRNLYFYEGASLSIADTEVTSHSRLIVQPGHPAPLQAGPDGAKLLLLQGKPINEPVAQHGPFVMNTRQELQQAYRDYQRTGFGGWPWQKTGPVHPRNEERFAVHADGRKDVPT